ncbi:glycosyltransferase family protein [Chitinophaga lutea]|uniref:hypothetical protein n=1 Tax=Chitinophaga lutea TaxID=2488634 RepID=UPI000F50BFEE|nr:hypothetical protein [Chitinophaga lutea]
MNEIASIRLFCFAKYWEQNGVRVSVLTTKKSAPADLSYQKDISPSIAIYELEYRRKFRFLNIASEKKTSPLSSVELRPKTSWRALLKRVGRHIYYGLGLSQIEHHNWVKVAAEKGIQISQEENITHIFSSFGPSQSHVIASRIISKISNTAIWVADYRDLWSQNHIYSTKGIFNLIEKAIERKVLRRAKLITTVSEPLRIALLNLHSDKQVMTIYNGFDPADFPSTITQARAKKRQTPIKIAYLGRIYPGFRDPSPLFQAIRELELADKLESGSLLIQFYGKFMGNLEALIAKYNVTQWVEVVGQVDYSESLRIQRDCDWLLFLESSRREAAGVLPGKLFEYIMSRTPILGIGIDPSTSAGELIIESNTGLALGNNIATIKNALLTSVLSSNHTYSLNENFMRKYSRKVQAEELLAVLKKIGH